MRANHVHELIGNTPVVKLNRLTEGLMGDVYVKLEWANPGGSVKDRIALNMIETAEKTGALKPGDTIVEPTSGNTGIGLALVGASKGYHVVITMPDSVSIERRKILKGYGATLILTDGEKGMKGAIAKATELKERHGYYMPMQFENAANPAVHEATTAQEILRDFDKLDHLVVGVGTGGTITGTSRVLKQTFPSLRVTAVEPADSAVLSGKEPGKHQIQGIGAGFVPPVLDTKAYDDIITITNEDALKTARDLAKKEGLFVGISSGANVAAALEIAKRAKHRVTILTFSPSNAERYLSTALFSDLS